MEGTFLQHYFAALTEHARSLCSAQELMAALRVATEAMHRDQGTHGPTNEQKFAEAFAPQLGRSWDELKAFFERFYEERFPALCVHAQAHPDARRAVETCLDAGYSIVIATNPLFPARAIQHRLAWTGIDDLPFTLITAYENMHTCKPAPAYYAEIACQIDIAPARCLMVGNDVRRDIAPARRAGMYTFLADQWLANPDPEVRPNLIGTLEDLIAYIANE